jgi:hypothetical protein
VGIFLLDCDVPNPFKTRIATVLTEFTNLVQIHTQAKLIFVRFFWTM